MPGEKAVIGLGERLWLKPAGDDIEYILEVAVDGEPLHDRVCMSPGAIGENELAPRQPLQRSAERRVGLDRRMIDLMDVIEVVVRIHAVLDHHASHRGAIAPVKILLLAKRIVVSSAQEFCDVDANAVVDLLPQIEVMRIERVVEVEDPRLDVRKGARRGGSVRVRRRGRDHGGLLANRHVCQPPPVRSLM